MERISKKGFRGPIYEIENIKRRILEKVITKDFWDECHRTPRVLLFVKRRFCYPIPIAVQIK